MIFSPFTMSHLTGTSCVHNKVVHIIMLYPLICFLSKTILKISKTIVILYS